MTTCFPSIAPIASEISVTCYDLKLLSLVNRRQKFSDTARRNSTCYNTIRFLCNILTGIRSGVRKLTGIRTDVRKLERIVDTYGFTYLIMSASVCRQRIFYRYVICRLWFQCKHFLTISHLQVVYFLHDMNWWWKVKEAYFFQPVEFRNYVIKSDTKLTSFIFLNPSSINVFSTWRSIKGGEGGVQPALRVALFHTWQSYKIWHVHTPISTKFIDQISGNFGHPSRSYGGPKIGWWRHQSVHIL